MSLSEGLRWLHAGSVVTLFSLVKSFFFCVLLASSTERFCFTNSDDGLAVLFVVALFSHVLMGTLLLDNLRRRDFLQCGLRSVFLAQLLLMLSTFHFILCGMKG